MLTTLNVLALVLLLAPLMLYPALLWLRARFFPQPVSYGGRDASAPTVDLVICAHNEADSIGGKIDNALALEYPTERLTIWIASDGSTDATVDIARACRDPRVEVLELPRGGKAAALNRAVASGQGAVIAFSDANSDWEPGALRALVAPLADPKVGGVAGNQRYARPDKQDGSAGERGYWSYDRLLKRWQSAAGSTISATGAIYAVRRSLFAPAPPDATDDFMVSTAVVAQGQRLVFAEDAVAWEDTADPGAGEFRRKVRVITRGLRGVYYRRGLMNPRHYGFYAVLLAVHKLWRRMLWLPLVGLIVLAPLGLAVGGTSRWLALGVLAFVAAAAAARSWPELRRYRPFAIAYYIALVNLACAVAAFNAIRGERVSQWSSERSNNAS